MPSPLPPSTASGRLFTALRMHGGISRARATAESGLALSMAGTAVDELERLGLIRSQPAAQATGLRGRPSPDLTIDGDGAAAIVVEIHADEVTLAVVDAARSIRHQESHPIDMRGLSPRTAVAEIATLINELHDRHHSPRFVGIGISVPGIVGRKNGIAHAVLSLGWSEVPIVELLAASLTPALPVTLGNDAMLGALAEFRTGRAAGPSACSSLPRSRSAWARR